MPKVGAAAVMPSFIVVFVLRVIPCIRCISHLTDIIFHGTGLVEYKNDIRRNILFLDSCSLGAGCKGFQCDGIGAIFVGSSRLADFHAVVGVTFRIGSRARHN